MVKRRNLLGQTLAQTRLVTLFPTLVPVGLFLGFSATRVCLSALISLVIYLVYSCMPHTDVHLVNLTRSGGNLHVRRGMHNVRTLLDRGFAIGMNSREHRGFVTHYLIREESLILLECSG